MAKGYEVHAIVRPEALDDPGRRLARLAGVLSQLNIHPGSVDDYPAVRRIVAEVSPDECYHLAAQSFVSYSFDDESSTFNTNVNSSHYMLGALRELAPECRVYFAASSEMFGEVRESPQDEKTPFQPWSCYGISKACGHYLVGNYRRRYGMHASSGILYNHESPRRGVEYVTRKITSGIARILAGRQNELRLGSIHPQRDWGHAREYVEAMWRMLQQDRPDDYVIATGKSHSVRQFAEFAFAHAGLDYRDYVVTDPSLHRPPESTVLRGDNTKARAVLGWSPQIPFEDLVREMVESDCAALNVALPRPKSARATP